MATGFRSAQEASQDSPLQELDITPEFYIDGTDIDHPVGVFNCLIDGVAGQEADWKLRTRPAAHGVIGITGAEVDARGAAMILWEGHLYIIVRNFTAGVPTSASIFMDGTPMTEGALIYDEGDGEFIFEQTVELIPKLVFKTRKRLWYVRADAPAVVIPVPQETFPTYPLDTADGIVYLDQRLYVITPDGEFYESDQNDPTTWTAKALYALMDSSQVEFLAKQRTYVVAFKQRAIEVFYNAASETSGLARYPSAKLDIGLQYPQLFQQLESTQYFVGVSPKGGLSINVYAGLQINDIATPTVIRLLEGADLSRATSFVFKSGGYSYYCINLPDVNLAGGTGGVTLAYQTSSKRWLPWTQTNTDTNTQEMLPWCASIALANGQVQVLSGQSAIYAEFDDSLAFESLADAVPRPIQSDIRLMPIQLPGVMSQVSALNVHMGRYGAVSARVIQDHGELVDLPLQQAAPIIRWPELGTAYVWEITISPRNSINGQLFTLYSAHAVIEATLHG